MVKHIRVEYDQICVDSTYEDEEFGSWEEIYDSSIGAVYIISENDRASYSSDIFTVPDDAEEVFVVYMIYDTGDSYGRATGKIDIIHCTANKEAANELAKKIVENREEYYIKYVDDFGREILITNKGFGYFEYIQYIEVKSFYIGPKKSTSTHRYIVN